MNPARQWDSSNLVCEPIGLAYTMDGTGGEYLKKERIKKWELK